MDTAFGILWVSITDFIITVYTTYVDGGRGAFFRFDDDTGGVGDGGDAIFC